MIIRMIVIRIIRRIRDEEEEKMICQESITDAFSTDININ